MSTTNQDKLLRIVRGNAFAIKINVKAIRVDGTEIEDFVLGESKAVLLLNGGGIQQPIPFEVDGNAAIIRFDGHLTTGYYGLDMSGTFRDEAWRFSTKILFQIVETSQQANVPEDCILYDDTYLMDVGITMYIIGPQADWNQDDQTAPDYIKNKPDLSVFATNEALQAEAQTRQQADTTLQGNINAEATARANVDTTLQGNIDAEATARQQADTTLQGNIGAEATARANADTTLQGNIDAEATDRANADTTLQGNIDAEATARANADTTLQGNITAEETRAKAAEKKNADDIDAIEAMIPQQASAQNKLATEGFVNSSVATNTAYYISDNGQPFTSLADLEAYSGTLTNNDYAFVVGTDAAGNTTYTRYKYNAATEQWGEEYVLNNSSFTAAQWAAISSGITSGDVEKLAALPTKAQLDAMLAGKQDTISDLSTIRSGAQAGATAVQPSALNDYYNKTQVDTALGQKEDKSNKVTELTSHSTDTQYPSAKAVYDFVKEETGKAREIVQVVATADSGSVAESAVLKIKVNGGTVAEGTGAVNIALEYGTEYTVECSRVYDYLTPAPQTFTAGQSVRTVTMAYTYIQRDTITIDQTETDELTMVSGDVQGDVIKAIRAASHLYLGTQTEAGNQLICQLKDDDGTKYYDGTAAAMDGTEGDQWLKLPVFWWKATGIGTPDADDTYDQYSFSFAFAGEPDPTWHKWEGDMNLLGAKKMYVANGKGYSRSGIQGSANYTQAQGNSYAEARGTGYATVTWEWQWMMCVLFYAWYGRMNSQAQCGSGSNSNTRTLGTKDSLGMTDTTSANGNSDNTKFWGIENWWGDIAEWIGNITSNNYVVTIVDMNTKQSRQVSGWYPFGGTGGYASRFKVTDKMDFIPRAKSGTETTFYCDLVNGNSGSRVVSRSSDSASASGGVAFVYSPYAPSYAYASIGSRLAFNGVVTEADSVAAYKAALA